MSDHLETMVRGGMNIETHELPMKLKQIDPFCLKSPTSFSDVRSDSIYSDLHRMEYAVLCCGEDVLPERIGGEKLALQRYDVSLRKPTGMNSH